MNVDYTQAAQLFYDIDEDLWEEQAPLSVEDSSAHRRIKQHDGAAEQGFAGNISISALLCKLTRSAVRERYSRTRYRIKD